MESQETLQEIAIDVARLGSDGSVGCDAASAAFAIHCTPLQCCVATSGNSHHHTCNFEAVGKVRDMMIDKPLPVGVEC